MSCVTFNTVTLRPRKNVRYQQQNKSFIYKNYKHKHFPAFIKTPSSLGNFVNYSVSAKSYNQTMSMSDDDRDIDIESDVSK